MPMYPLVIGAQRAASLYGVKVTGAPLPPAPPVNTVPPVLTGTGNLGDVLTCNTGTWDNPGAFTYQWRRNGATIAGTAATHTVIAADSGTNVTCNVTSTNSDGAATATSNAIACA